MSLSELKLFEHATHLDGNRPEGMRYERVWKKESATNFSLKLRSSQQQVLASYWADRQLQPVGLSQF